MLETALKEYGTLEIPGDRNNPEILKYFHEIGHEWVPDDETAWCSAFMNWCALKAGYQGSGKLNARSWLDVGWEDDPIIGRLVVLWRESPDSWKGHVGLFIKKTESHVWVLGGNQSNMVKISPYPINRVLSYRKLRPL